jgi:hypothetical protein
MPVVVAAVGIVGTYLITTQQDRNTKERATADRQIKILEIFAQKITSRDKAERELALRLLTVVDGDLAAKLANAVFQTEPKQSAIRKVASEVAEEATARARLLPRVYIHIRKEDDRSAAQSVAEKLKTGGFVVPGIERLAEIGPSSSELRYFRKDDKSWGGHMVDLLHSKGVVVNLKYIAGYEDSQTIRPGHYELWFAPGQPK